MVICSTLRRRISALATCRALDADPSFPVACGTELGLCLNFYDSSWGNRVTISFAQGEEALAKQALGCLAVGYFHGARQCASRLLESHSTDHYRQAALQVDWFCRIYTWRDLDAQRSQIHPRNGDRGQGFAELALLRAKAHGTIDASDAAQIVLDVADGQSGLLRLEHPTAILALAELTAGASPSKAIGLLNIALGYLGPYRSRTDVSKLGFLLTRIGCPLAVWGHWAWIVFEHLEFSYPRSFYLKALLGCTDAARWAEREYQDARETIVEILKLGPPTLGELVQRMAHSVRGEGIKALPTNLGVKASAFPGHESEWSTLTTQRYRYYWWQEISDREKKLIHNGDWAVMETPTDDFSMALAQWWRVLETILNRIVVRELSELFSKNPSWRLTDMDRLSKKKQERNKVFLDLAKPSSTNRLSLSAILILIEKCLATSMDGGESGSKLRDEASRHLSSLGDLLNPIVADEKGPSIAKSKLHLEAIKYYRNRSSHDEEIDEIDAAVGRVYSVNILNQFFNVVKAREGLTPVYGSAGPHFE